MKNRKEKIKEMMWSYSRVSAFNTCKYMWMLQYLDKKEGEQNFFSLYGLFHHDMMEKFWEGRIDTWDLSSYYEKNYYKEVTLNPPPFLERYNFASRSYNYGKRFYDDFSWNKDDFDVLGNEDTIKSEYKGYKITVRPDTLVRHKPTEEIWLIDYKTSSAFDKKGVVKKDKIEPYKKQLSLYAHFIEKEQGHKVDKIVIVFPKYFLGKTIFIDYNKSMAKEVLDDWFLETIHLIEEESDFEPTLNEFFCNNLCSVRKHCQYRKDEYDVEW